MAARRTTTTRITARVDHDRGVFMISVAAELAEMHPQTLRMYEQRGLIEPKRSPKGTRLYSQADVERLRGEGPPRLGGGGRGDIRYRFVIEVPQPSTDEQRDVAERFGALFPAASRERLFVEE
jgi:hypothetical protein